MYNFRLFDVFLFKTLRFCCFVCQVGRQKGDLRLADHIISEALCELNTAAELKNVGTLVCAPTFSV